MTDISESRAATECMGAYLGNVVVFAESFQVLVKVGYAVFVRLLR